MILETLELGDLQTNCYILGCNQTREALVIDPAAEAERIFAVLEKHGLRLTTIVFTHAHADHIAASGELKKATGAKILLHRDDAPLLADPQKNLTSWVDANLVLPSADELLNDGDKVEVGAEIRLEVLHTPGHTPGGICLLGAGLLFSGDTLFAGAVGRHDLFGGDFKALIASLMNRLKPLPDDTKVYSGHGPESTMGIEKQENLYLTTDW